MTLRDSKVLARCEQDGRLRVAGGRVEIRYKPGSPKAYQAGERNLSALPGSNDLLADETCPDDPTLVLGAPSPSAKKGGASGARGGSSQARKDAAAQAHASTHGPAAFARGGIVAYADGACSGNPGPCGLGVVVVDGETRRELSEYLGTGTNNIAELTAILRVLENVTAGEARPVIIFTDSSYAIGVLQKGWKAKANQELIAEVKKALKRLAAVELRYVPGHSGVALNERADVLATDSVKRRASRAWTSEAL
jgi:ribonuclease HI